MKAIQYASYGNSNVLKLNQVDKPSIQEDEVLIKITATTVNPFDMKVRSGSMEKQMPIKFPYTPGTDVSGVAEAVGSKVERIKVGDEVFASTYGGTYAEYIAIKEEQVGLKPNNVSANEAAALVIPLVTSYTVLVEAGQLEKGQKILIHGASGAVGSTMVQMAKALGAYVTGSGPTSGIDMIKELGADEAIDYKTEDFTKIVKEADLVADLVGGETQTKSFEVLKKGGKLLSIVMPPSAELAEKYGVKAQFVMSNPSYKKLDFGKELVEEGKIKAQIAKIMKLEQAAEAQDMVSAGGVNGKVVMEIE